MGFILILMTSTTTAAAMPAFSQVFYSREDGWVVRSPSLKLSKDTKHRQHLADSGLAKVFTD
ncbi:hypothetical protein BS50DRAFT_82203 [Corynespora cassiicola Philippines]|uniref:Uncharacterized protein n=1 Tax=Corynespora cassiicola Philippines TaxID=1448308 RepID=A0A2T2MZI4_CORCC|nr:hypothetical protein BS50DRAFT_82203 [Corynespora cassiicola Philippines]